MSELRPQLAVVAAHIGRPGESSATITLVRQEEGYRPEGVDRSYPARWFGRYYVAGCSRFPAGAAFDEITDSIGFVYNDVRFQLAARRAAVVNLSGQGFLLRELRKHRIGMLVPIAVTDSRAVTETPGMVAVGKSDLVGALVAVVQTDRLRILAQVEGRAGIIAALDTISPKAPRPAKEPPPGELVVEGEDAAVLAMQYGVWWAETRAPFRETGGHGSGAWVNETNYSPIGQSPQRAR